MDELRESGVAWATLAHCYEDAGDEDARVQALRESCRLAPTADRLVLLGSALAQQGDIPNAEAALRRAIELEPGHSEAKANLAYWVIPADDRRSKERLYREAIQDDPQNAFAWEQLGILVCCFEPRHEEVEFILLRAVELNHDAIFARWSLADLLWQRADVPAAKVHYQHLVNEADSFIAIRVGEFFAACGEFHIAERVFLRSLGLEENAEVLWRYGELLRDAGQQELGNVLINRAREIAPEDARIARDAT